MILCVAFAAAAVVDRIVWAVGSRVVTASDLRFEAEFDPHDRSSVAVLDDPAYSIEARLLDFAILRELAGDTTLYRPDSRDVRLRYEAVRASFPSPADFDAFLARWGHDPTTLQALLSSRIAVERYVTRNGLNRRAEGATSDWDRYQSWMEEVRPRVSVRVLP